MFWFKKFFTENWNTASDEERRVQWNFIQNPDLLSHFHPSESAIVWKKNFFYYFSSYIYSNVQRCFVKKTKKQKKIYM